jgi:hypothetical protein
MPTALTARIEAALAAEAAARSTTTETAAANAAVAADGAPAVRGHRRTLAPGPGRSRLALRVAAAAAAVVVLGGGGYGLSRLLAGGGGSASSSTAEGPVMGPAGARARHAPSGHESAALPNGLSGPLIVHSGTNYRPGQLNTQVRTTLARFRPRQKLGGARAHAPAPSGGSADFANLSACLRQAVGDRRAELVDEADYEGRPADIVVIPGARANALRVLVFGTRCSPTAPGPMFSTLLPSGG